MLAENGRRDITQIIQKLEPERRYQVAFDYNKLRGRIVEIFNTQSNFASAMGWSERILALKMNGMCSWKQIDICKAIQLLKLTIEDIPIVCTRVGHYSVLTG